MRGRQTCEYSLHLEATRGQGDADGLLQVTRARLHTHCPLSLTLQPAAQASQPMLLGPHVTAGSLAEPAGSPGGEQAAAAGQDMRCGCIEVHGSRG